MINFDVVVFSEHYSEEVIRSFDNAQCSLLYLRQENSYSLH